MRHDASRPPRLDRGQRPSGLADHGRHAGDGAKALRTARAIETGVLSINSNTSVRVSTPFGGFKQSGVGRETHLMMLEHYQQTKNLLVSYSPKALGFF